MLKAMWLGLRTMCFLLYSLSLAQGPPPERPPSSFQPPLTFPFPELPHRKVLTLTVWRHALWEPVW